MTTLPHFQAAVHHRHVAVDRRLLIGANAAAERLDAGQCPPQPIYTRAPSPTRTSPLMVVTPCVAPPPPWITKSSLIDVSHAASIAATASVRSGARMGQVHPPFSVERLPAQAAGQACNRSTGAFRTAREPGRRMAGHVAPGADACTLGQRRLVILREERRITVAKRRASAPKRTEATYLRSAS
jgi:hypothetical protein